MFYVWNERQLAVKVNAQEVSLHSTTGTGVPFRRVGFGWSLRNLQKCMHTVLEGDNTLASAQSESLLRHCWR